MTWRCGAVTSRAAGTGDCDLASNPCLSAAAGLAADGA